MYITRYHLGLHFVGYRCDTCAVGTNLYDCVVLDSGLHVLAGISMWQLGLAASSAEGTEMKQSIASCRQPYAALHCGTEIACGAFELVLKTQYISLPQELQPPQSWRQTESVRSIKTPGRWR